jgi:polysaccharide pyruvyl transferase WcaK-like protein
VRVDLARAETLARSGADDPFHYGFGFFHHNDAQTQRRYERYLDGIAAALDALARERACFPIVIGMDRIDRQACADLRARLERPAPSFLSGEVPPGEIVALLRACGTLVTSRFHAAVTALPAGVAVVALSMDERLANLLEDSAQSERLIASDDPELGTRLLHALRAIPARRDAIRALARRTTARELLRIGEMGIRLCDELCARLPGFAPPDRPRTARAYLPALAPELDAILTEVA